MLNDSTLVERIKSSIQVFGLEIRKPRPKKNLRVLGVCVNLNIEL